MLLHLPNGPRHGHLLRITLALLSSAILLAAEVLEMGNPLFLATLLTQSSKVRTITLNSDGLSEVEIDLCTYLWIYETGG